MESAKELGEERIHEVITKNLEKDPKELLGYNDDAIAIPIDEERILIAHTNALVSSTDVLPRMPLKSIGVKAVVMNISDIVSKGAKPLTLLFSWGIPKDYSIKALLKISSGLNETARKYGTYVTGGDINESYEFFISGVALGICKKDELMPRSGARPGDILAITGELGLTSMAYKILLENFEAPHRIKLNALNSVFFPKARLHEALALAKTRSVTACMDISDGLAKSLHWLSKASKVGFKVSEIPIPKEISEFALKKRLDPLKLALYEGGEEYELLVCIKPNKWNKALKKVLEAGGRLYKIGEAIEERKLIFQKDEETEEEIENIGWEHFLKWG
ncbi:MAG: thiamine-phosphate kinase [Candidatus Bathyarchaeia archaeon]